MTNPPGKLTPGGAGSALRARPPQDEPTTVLDRAAISARRGTSVPVRAEGLEMLGAFERSGHKEAPSLVRRRDGQTVQLTPLLYAVLDAIDGRRRADQIAAVVGERTGKLASEEDICFLIDQKLRPLGLVQGSDGCEPQLRKANPLLGLKLRFVISNPRITKLLAAPFAKLFFAPFALLTTIAFFVLSGWLLFERGLGGAVREALYQPHLLLLVLALTTVSAAFHELGHAAALVRGGGKPGVMGAGLYLVWPAFYTDVTDAYRLDRRARLRVDAGGLYFNALFALGSFGLWALTGWEALLAVIPLQALQMVRQLVPLVRFDGYHLLADITGVPDLFAHIKPILLGALPTHWGRSENSALKPWVRFTVTAWVLVVVPLLLMMLLVMVITLPRILATAWDSLIQQSEQLSAAWAQGDIALSLVRALAVLAIAIPILSIGYLLARLVRRVSTRVWRGTEGRPARRAVAIVVAAALLAGLFSAWWPDGQYTPIQARERGRLADVTSMKTPLGDVALPWAPAAASVTQPDAEAGEVTTIEDAIMPAEVIQSAEETDGALTPDLDTGYRFTLPDGPGEGDNQALAVNYTAGTAVVALAASLIFSDSGDVANSNEAYALASCVRCLAAAIAFQLVIVLDEANVLVPENTAVALTQLCVQCATLSVATQLIVALDEPLSEEAMAKLNALWARLEELEQRANKIPLDELLAELAELEAAIRVVLEEEGATFLDSQSEEETDDPMEAEPSPTTATTPTSEPTPSTSPSDTAEPSPTPTSEPSPSSSSSSTEPSPTPTSEPSSEPSP